MENLIELYRNWKGEEPFSTELLQGAGRNHKYYLLVGKDGSSVMGVIGTRREEDRAFIYLTRHFTLRQLPVPKIIATSADELCYLQSDLGQRSLYDVLRMGREAGGRYNQKEKGLLIKTISQLPNLQIRGARGLDWSNCYPQPEFDE